MGKVFNTTADCKPDLHYMVSLDKRLTEIRKLIDRGDYFAINRARQYGKTTTLRALGSFLQPEYCVILMDFQMFGAGEFADENEFSLSFARTFLRILKRNRLPDQDAFSHRVNILERAVAQRQSGFRLQQLFENLSDLCAASHKKMILMMDEVDSATNNQIFLDFLAQLRAYYIDRDVQPTFHSVVLASVYDVRNLKGKLRPEDQHRINSPWNIAADFKVDMSFSKEEIAGMLREYEADHDSGMDTDEMAGLLYEYTSGYPYLVSRLCKLMDEQVYGRSGFGTGNRVWTRKGFNEAVKILLNEKNPLFESLIGKLTDYPELSQMLDRALFAGKSIVYNTDNAIIDRGEMFGFIKNSQGIAVISNRLFEMRLYNYYLSTSEMQNQELYTASLEDRNQFITGGQLNMRLVLEKFVMHFHDLYGDSNEKFVEEEGRKYFLLYLRPIINGTGNYYIESRTRERKRTDIIVDYRGVQYIIELKIWRGEEYNNRGEAQLAGYLDDYHQKKGYMVSFNFNKKKQIGVHELVIGEKVLVEAVV